MLVPYAKVAGCSIVMNGWLRPATSQVGRISVVLLSRRHRDSFFKNSFFVRHKHLNNSLLNIFNSNSCASNKHTGLKQGEASGY